MVKHDWITEDRDPYGLQENHNKISKKCGSLEGEARVRVGQGLCESNTGNTVDSRLATDAFGCIQGNVWDGV